MIVMRVPVTLRMYAPKLLLLAGALVGAPLTAQTQDKSAARPCPVPAHGQAQDTTNCTPQPASTAKRFPYPGEEPAAAPTPDRQIDAPSSSAAKPKTPPTYPGDPDAPSAPSPSTSTKGKTPPAYPGDPEAAAGKDGEGVSSSSSSNSSSSSGIPDDAADNPGPLADAGSNGDTTPKPDRRRRKLPKVDAQTPEARESEDLDVADFYIKSGNFPAAYARAKDAVSIMPSDPFAQFALADAARRIGKKDEALEHYASVLKLDPNPKQKKASERALAELNAPSGK